MDSLQRCSWPFPLCVVAVVLAGSALDLVQYAQMRAGAENFQLFKALNPARLLSKAPDSSPCPPISFAQTSSQLTLGFSDSGTTAFLGPLYRQADGNFTASGFSIPMPIISNVGTKVVSIPQAQAYFAACQGVASWTPAGIENGAVSRSGTSVRTLCGVAEGSGYGRPGGGQ